MDDGLMRKLLEISPEEQAYRNGTDAVRRDIYTVKDAFEVDAKLLLRENRLITVRTHSRFIDFPAHRHNYIEIMYVCQGTITHYIDGKELIMEQGDMLLLNQHVCHGVKRAEYGDIGINFIALPEFFDIPLQMLKEHNVIADFLLNTFRYNHPVSHYLLFRLGSQKAIENLVENMVLSITEGNPEEDGINQYSMGLVFLYLMNHMESLEYNSSQSYKDVVVQATMKYIDTWYRTANLGKVARDFNLTVSALSKMIKNQTGHTFQEHLMRKRFQKAVVYLVETQLPADEIAANVGYENVSFFYRQFKMRYGMTPRQYRMEHKGDGEIRI